jgi:lipopolysaccharide biosynthesis protein
VKLYLKEHPELIPHDCEPLSHFIQAQKAGIEEVDFTQWRSTLTETGETGKVAVHAHLYYADLADEFVHYINQIPDPFDCFFTTDTSEKRREILNTIGNGLRAQKFEVRVTPNVGRDIAPFVVGCRDLLVDYDYLCHIHSKKALHTTRNDYGNAWRKNMLDHLLGSTDRIQAILHYFSEHPDVGLFYPTNFIPIEYRWKWDINLWNMEYLKKRIGVTVLLPFRIDCAVGSMFWVRTKSFRKLYEAEITYSEFENEVGQLDGALAHAFERLFVYIAQDEGFKSRIIRKQQGSRV